MKRLVVFLTVLLALLPAGAAEARAPTRRVLGPGQSTSFYVNGPAVKVDLLANGATLFASVNRKSQGRVKTLPDTGKVVRVSLAWDLPPGPQRITLTARAGTLDIRRWVIPGGRMLAGSLPLLAVFGDSIALGMTSGGPGGFTGGWADQIAPLARYRVANLSAGFTSAACYGRRYVGAVLATRPDRVIVAFGVNDMIAGPNGWGCDTDLDGFVTSMHDILSATDTLGVPVYVSAILPTGRAPEAARAAWNAALEAEVAGHAAIWVDPSAAIDYPADYAGDLHPSLAGHVRLASFWADVLAEPVGGPGRAARGGGARLTPG